MRLVAAALWLTGWLACGAELKFQSVSLDKFPEGDPPPAIFVVEGAMQLKSRASGKVLEISGARPETDAGAVFGPATKGAAVIEARVLSSKARRAFPRFGIGVHGQTGYRLFVVPAKRELQL